MRLREALRRLTGRGEGGARKAPPVRGHRTLVVIIDGTLSSLEPGRETNAGQAFRLLERAGPEVAIWYEDGLQWQGWRDTRAILTGQGLGAQIERAYGWLASAYRPGDRIWLLGYSRGAYAVRSLGGMIGRVGLLRRDQATARNLRGAWRFYQSGRDPMAFTKAYCHDRVEIEAIGVWDTVKALGLRLPVLWLLSARATAFHDHRLGGHIRTAFHALARDETRRAYTPVLWETTGDFQGRVEQLWFRGTHGDVGGQLGGRAASRPLANIPFVWVMEQLDRQGLRLPEGWQAAYATDPSAPSIGRWAGWAALFWWRWPRRIGRDPSEALHPSVEDF
ncbi:MAG: DUF2235 domain-containing protein [Shimia sp.]